MFYRLHCFSRPLARCAKIISLLLLLSNTHIQPLEAKEGTKQQDYSGVLPKDAWPELLFHDRFEVAHTIHDPINRHDDTNIRIFAQYPYEEDHRKAPDFDKDTDYWLYITSNDIVYEIPKAGRWHPNRINPGWADLLGAHYKVALKTIVNDMLGVLIEYGPVGIPPPNDTQINRVWLYLDENENVANIPRVG